ncbi:hypothetical protein AArcS_0718 [Natranaeroarchaeum sulfidigenes]|uniref:Uncharacterized protein n=1 Tax=Natranaeroarchaeum sulfidigenes TaxID=2784880 RepID=A0A897MSE7_9EURY|nr:hypothetical protein AArcS_0718 [Natranaeroarchaeum sulfidigenes]
MRNRRISINAISNAAFGRDDLFQPPHVVSTMPESVVPPPMEPGDRIAVLTPIAPLSLGERVRLEPENGPIVFE